MLMALLLARYFMSLIRWPFYTFILSSIILKMENVETPKKPRFLCLHGGGSNATTFKEQLSIWPDFVLEKMDLVFINAPYPAVEHVTIAGDRLDWYTPKTMENLEEGIAYIEECMLKLGPIDGVIGLSQGAIVTSLLPGLQEHGAYFTKVGKIEHVVIISGAKLGGITTPGSDGKIPEIAFSSLINIPSLHIFGENDYARETASELVEAFVDPLVIYHHGGHEVPKLDEEGLKTMLEFLKKIKAVI